MTESFTIIKEHHFSFFDRLPALVPGDKATRIGARYQILDSEGNFKCYVDDRYLIIKIGRRIIGNKEPTPLMIELGKEIKRAREMRDLTQAALAKELKLSKVYIAMIETGRKICSLEQLKRIAEALNFDLKIKLARKYEKQEVINEQAT